ncbi:signal peptide protein [Rhizobium leguminosarum bv. trifolii WSM1689]|uniref:cell envelope integrity protein TolA n=1 Tax=Rhizobium leguminosarum TaxID=384 RepID=UPI0003E0A47D|nr:cell envelope integrity protein TolA [Rhizobium leguminosarum]AHF85513.1 signal peptide protein [Rhizobium leguminosarum bv. trifolii WSM1689]MBY5739562.1 cell envelope integrity protein TolA [Rhizobium leguminosarum]
MPRNPLHFAKSFGLYIALTVIVGCSIFPLNAGAETAGRANGSATATHLAGAEIDALRHAIENNFIVDGRMNEAGSVYATIHVKLDRDGQIVGVPDVKVRGGSERTRKSIADAGIRAIRRAAPFTMLPKDKYDAWKEVILNFDTSALTP